MLDYLRSHNKRFLLTAGLVSAVCVLFTTASACQLGFLATVVSNCCADYPEAHAMVLRRYSSFLFDSVDVDELRDRWKDWIIQIEQLEAIEG